MKTFITINKTILGFHLRGKLIDIMQRITFAKSETISYLHNVVRIFQMAQILPTCYTQPPQFFENRLQDRREEFWRNSITLPYFSFDMILFRVCLKWSV